MMICFANYYWGTNANRIARLIRQGIGMRRRLNSSPKTMLSLSYTTLPTVLISVPYLRLSWSAIMVKQTYISHSLFDFRYLAFLTYIPILIMHTSHHPLVSLLFFGAPRTTSALVNIFIQATYIARSAVTVSKITDSSHSNSFDNHIANLTLPIPYALCLLQSPLTARIRHPFIPTHFRSPHQHPASHPMGTGVGRGQSN